MLLDKCETESYPIASIPGSRGGGWFTRQATEPTIVVKCAPVDAISAGFAFPLQSLLSFFDLIETNVLFHCLDKKNKEIVELKTEIAKIKRAKKCKR